MGEAGGGGRSRGTVRGEGREGEQEEEKAEEGSFLLTGVVSCSKRGAVRRCRVKAPHLPFPSYLTLVATTFVMRPKMSLLSCSLA